MGAGFSGKDGTVKIGSTDICEIRNWKFNPKSNNPKYASNKTSGYKRTVAGVKEGTGSMSGAWDHANDFLGVIDVGTGVTLKLYTDGTHFYTVPSVIDDVSVNIDVDNGEIVSWDANFSSNGVWTNPASPMMAPEGFGTPGAGGAVPPPQQTAPGQAFSSEQMNVIAATAAQAATAALQAMFANLNPALAGQLFAPPSPAQNSEPPAPVMSEPGGPEPAPTPPANA